MATVRLRNVHPLGAVDLPTLGLVVEAGQEFDCPADRVGEKPGVWQPPTEAQRAEAYRGLVTREVGDAPNVTTEVLGAGSGLLGTGHFEIVQPPKAGKNSTPTSPQEA